MRLLNAVEVVSYIRQVLKDQMIQYVSLGQYDGQIHIVYFNELNLREIKLAIPDYVEYIQFSKSSGTMPAVRNRG